MTSNGVTVTTPAGTIVNVMNGATIIKTPSPEVWKKAYSDDVECKLVLKFLDDPSTITNKNLQTIHRKYQQPLRSSNLVKEDD